MAGTFRQPVLLKDALSFPESHFMEKKLQHSIRTQKLPLDHVHRGPALDKQIEKLQPAQSIRQGDYLASIAAVERHAKLPVVHIRNEQISGQLNSNQPDGRNASYFKARAHTIALNADTSFALVTIPLPPVLHGGAERRCSVEASTGAATVTSEHVKKQKKGCCACQ